MLMGFTNNGIKLPITQTAACINNSRAFIDANSVDQLPPATVTTILFASLLLTTQVTVKNTALCFILDDILINTLMANSDAVFCLKPKADLLRAPFLSKQTFDQEPPLYGNTRLELILTTFNRKIMCLLGTIPTQAPITSKFTTNGGFVKSNYFRSLRLVQSCFH